MARSGHPQSGYPLSRAEIGKFTRKGPIQEFLDYLATRDVITVFDDFKQIAYDSNMWAVANGGGASVASFAVLLGSNGSLRGTTGTGNGDTASASLIGPKNWYGDAYASVECKWTPITAVTETRIEIGFVDVVPGSTKPVVNVLATPSVNTSVVDCALDTYDHTSTTTTNQLTTIGGSITAAKTTFTAPTAIAAATAVTSRILLVANQAYLWRDGSPVVKHNTAATDYIEGGNGVAFWATVRASNATSKSLDLDYVRLTQERV